MYAAISVVAVVFGDAGPGAHTWERGMTNSISREVLKQVLDEVRAHRKSTGDRFAFKLTDAWVYKVGTDHWEFHFGMFYWHGSADNGCEARAKGWRAWLVAGGKPT